LNKHKALSAVTTESLNPRLFGKLRDVIFSVNEGEKTFMAFDRRLVASWGKLSDDEIMERATQRVVSFVVERAYPIVVDGMVWGYTKDPYDVCVRIKQWRSQDYGLMMVSSVFRSEQKMLLVRTQSGRLMRPLFNVMSDQGRTQDFVIPVSKRVLHALHSTRLERSKITLRNLYEQGTITFADVMEQESMLIGMDPQQLGDNPREFLQRVCVTHFEIDPSLIFGLRASRLPYPTHNQSPRLTYYIQMKSAAVGWPMLNKMDLTQTTTYELCYPQRSLTLTRTSVYAGCYDSPDTQLAFVMVASKLYNQEDACILNQSAIDLGFGRTHVYKRFTFSETRAKQYMHPNAPPLGTCLGDVVFCNPLEHDLEVDPRDAAIFQDMDAFGQLSNGTRVKCNERGQPLVGAYKVVGEWVEEVQTNGRKTQRLELSKELFAKYYKGDPRGTIAQVRVQTDELGLKHVEIVVVSTRLPTIGDKMSQPFQKNSCGMLRRREDMPMALGPEGINGMTPDVIINPHAFPSRMTLSPLIEVVAGYNALQEGKAMNATAFRDHGTSMDKENSIFNDNFGMGLKHSATCGFLDPYTGIPYKETYKGSIMYKQFTFGMMDFHRLKHMVIDKIQAAAIATKDTHTRQPVQGKKRGGAVRLGEMERDCLIAHGVSVALKDALFYRSDPYRIHVCTKCDHPAYFDRSQRVGVCHTCTKGTYDVVQVDIPYAGKLLFQELNAMGISVRFGTSE
jgi:DNA-directed RNA polymerase II subunit RPB2